MIKELDLPGFFLFHEFSILLMSTYRNFLCFINRVDLGFFFFFINFPILLPLPQDRFGLGLVPLDTPFLIFLGNSASWGEALFGIFAKGIGFFIGDPK